MGILTENFNPTLDGLNTRYIWSRGTEFRIHHQTETDLKKRYWISPEIESVMDVADRYSNIRNRTRSLIRAAFDVMTIDDVLPGSIVKTLNRLGINCDAVVLTIGTDFRNVVVSVKFSLYHKKSQGRERYVFMGFIELMIRDTAGVHKETFETHQDFWRSIIKVWKAEESVRVSSIFRRKKHCVGLCNKTSVQQRKFHQYVTT